VRQGYPGLLLAITCQHIYHEFSIFHRRKQKINNNDFEVPHKFLLGELSIQFGSRIWGVEKWREMVGRGELES